MNTQYILVRIICFILIFSSYIYSDEVIFKDNTGGLNSKASPLFLEDNESSDLLNIDLGTDGVISSRGGYTQLNTTKNPDQIDHLAGYKLNAGTLYMVCVANNLYKMDSFDGTWDDITGTTSITADTAGRSRIFEDCWIYTNGTDKPQSWTGTGTAADLDSINDIVLTKAKHIETYQNKLWLGNVVVDGSTWLDRAYYSAANDKDAWTANGYVIAGLDDGEEITGLKTLGKYIYAFKKRGVYKIRGTGDSTFPYITDKTKATEGCIAPDSIQAVNNVIIYLGQEGLCLFDGENSQIISYKIKPTLDGLSDALKIKAKSGVFKDLNQYWLSISDGDRGDRIIIWDYYHNSFLIHDGINASAMTSIIDSSETERFYFGDFLGYVYRSDQGRDDYPIGVQTAINSYYHTKHYDMKSLVITKQFKHLVIIYKYAAVTSTLNFYYTHDLQTTDVFSETLSLANPFSSVWDTALWDVDVWPGTGATYRRFDLRSSGITIRFKFSNDGLNEEFSIYGWGLLYKPLRIVEN